MTTKTLPLTAPTKATLVVLLLGLLVALGLASPAVAATHNAAPHGAHTAKHGFGGVRAKQRHMPRAIHASALQSLPAQVDLRNAADLATDAGNQGEVGSCVTWAIDFGMLGWYTRHTGRTQSFNPMYTFSQIHGANGYGSDPTAALEIAMTQGSDTMSHYAHANPGDTYNWWETPTQAEKDNAANTKITGYQDYSTGTGAGSVAFKDWIANELGTNGRPVAIGLRVRQGMNDEMNLNPRFGVAGTASGSRTPGAPASATTATAASRGTQSLPTWTRSR
jgi:hypothetical protein